MQTQASLGWTGLDKVDVRVTNRTGVAVALGDVVILDNERADVDSTTNQVGVPTGGVGNIVQVTTTAQNNTKQPYSVYGVVQRSAVDNAATVVRLSGFCDFVSVSATVVLTGATKSVITAPSTATVAALVLPQNDVLLVTTLTASGGAVNARPTKILFIPLTARTGAGLTDGWFDGVAGFGSVLKVPT